MFIQKKRNQLGRPIYFNDQPAEILPNLNLLNEFICRNPVDIGVQDSIQLFEHEVNTIRYHTETKGVNHTEGG
jgi:dynein intermediate chain 2